MTSDDEGAPSALTEKVSNKNYREDVRFSMQYTRWCLTLLGIWPDVVTNSTRMERFISKFLMPFPVIVITIVLIPSISLPFFVRLSPTQMLLLLAPLSIRGTSVLKSLVLISNREKIKHCLRHMETDWQRIENDDLREIMMRNLRVGKNLTIMSVLCIYSGVLFYNIVPFIMPRKINERNETVRPINVPGIEIYIDLRAGHNYEMALFVNWIGAFYVPTIVIAICNLGALLVCHACGQIQIIISKLEGLVDASEENISITEKINVVEKRIGVIIRMHVRVLRFATKIEELLRLLGLLEVVSSTLLICLVAYHIIQVRVGIVGSMPSVMIAISLAYNVFIFCKIGELLKEQCEEVGKSVYMTEWYKLPGKTGLSLIMFITMASHPRKLTAERIIELSIMTFGTIMRTSIGYLNMLRTMTE